MNGAFSIITEESERKNAAARPGGDQSANSEAEAIGFFQAFMLPNVMSYAIAFGFFKLVGAFSPFHFNQH